MNAVPHWTWPFPSCLSLPVSGNTARYFYERSKDKMAIGNSAINCSTKTVLTEILYKLWVCVGYAMVFLPPYRFQSLLNHIQGSHVIGDHQCGFRRNRSTTDQIFCIRQILEKKWEYNGTVLQLFIDFSKAYNSVRRKYYTTFSLNLVFQGH
jgi:hypothetical protein